MFSGCCECNWHAWNETIGSVTVIIGLEWSPGFANFILYFVRCETDHNLKAKGGIIDKDGNGSPIQAGNRAPKSVRVHVIYYVYWKCTYWCNFHTPALVKFINNTIKYYLTS